MQVLLIGLLVAVALAAVLFILVPRPPLQVEKVREKVRRGTEETVASIDPLTGQLLVEPTEDLRFPGEREHDELMAELSDALKECGEDEAERAA